MRALGLLKLYGDLSFRYFEYHYLRWTEDIVTRRWPEVQGGSNDNAASAWAEICMVLELDRKACADLMLLAHLSIAGRAEANEILWHLLTNWALDPDYEDLSHKVTKKVFMARRYLDRPPTTHEDRGAWRWQKYYVPRHPQWSPLTVPRAFTVLKGPRGEPLPPPACWGPPTQ